MRLRVMSDEVQKSTSECVVVRLCACGCVWVCVECEKEEEEEGG
jgi:hypothetical protein